MSASSHPELDSQQVERPQLKPGAPAQNQQIGQTAKSQLLVDASEIAREGQFLDALEKLQSCGPLKKWFGAERTEVSWIVRELGAPRLALWHVHKAFREEPERLECRNAYSSEILGSTGPLDALEFVEARPEPSQDDAPLEQLHWHWMQVTIRSMLRDFEDAGTWIQRMREIASAPEVNRPDMVDFVEAAVLERQDQYDEAFEAIDRAIKFKPARRTVQYKAHLLTLRGRDDEAYELLSQSDAKMQVGSFSWQMAGIAYERRDYADCHRLLQRFESLTPLRERSFGDSFLLFRSELARRLGNEDEAISYAKKSKSKRGRDIAETLADPERKQRVDAILDVPFIRQHELTCGPATLAAISKFWDMPAEHLEVADEICYAGTSTHAERKWANENGFKTAEFTVNEEITETLIGRGIPFTLVTRGAGYAHLQAVIGYDARTRSVVIRDPYHRTRGSYAIEEMLKDQAPHGPRGMVLIPHDRSDLIDGIEFPETALHDQLHEFDGALIGHDRDRAAEIFEAMRAGAPDHRLTLQAQRQLALYDGNEPEMLSAVDAMVEQFPEDASLQLVQVSLLGSLGRTTQRLERLRELASAPDSHPLLTLQLGEALAQDGRTRDEAEKLIRRSLQKACTHARGYSELADIAWIRSRRDEALRLFRFAACLEDTDEYLANRYYDAAVVKGKTDEVLEWLRGRFERFGGRSMHPAVTLVEALLRRRQHTDALAVIDEAIALRSDDADLKLFVAHTLADISSEHWPRCEGLLAEAKDAAPERSWRNTASHLCLLKGEVVQARDHLLSLLPLSPMSMPLRERIADLTAQIEGYEATTEFWRQSADEFPHHMPLLERYAMALRDMPLETTEPVLDKIIEANPDNAWAIREMAQHMLTAGKLDEAEALVAKAVELDAENQFVPNLQSSLAARRGDNDKAIEILHGMIQDDVNDEHAISRCLGLCRNPEQTATELKWLFEQLKSGTITGDVLLTYRDYAEPAMSADELLAQLQSALQKRPDLWQAHQAVTRQLTQMQRLDEASEIADAAVQQFSLEPNALFERYRVAMAAADHDKQREMLESLRLLRPGNAVVLRSLAELESTHGRHEQAREILEELVAAQPVDPVNRGYLGDCLLELDLFEEALEQFERAARIAPGYDFAWNMLERIADRLGKENYNENLAREIVEQRPHEADAWLQLSSAASVKNEFEQAHEYLDKAEKIDPYREAIHSLRSRYLLSEGDHEAALNALQPSIYPEVPVSLSAHRAQLLWDLGAQDAGYQVMKEITQAEPSYLPAWRRLERWAVLRNDPTQAIEAVEHQVQANPHDPEVLDAAGSTFHELDEKDRAIEMYRKTIEIAPSFTASRCQLFDLLVEKESWDEAETCVTDLSRLDDHPAVIGRRMQCAHQRGDQAQVNQALDDILHADVIPPGPMHTAVGLMVDNGRSAELLTKLDERIEELIAEDSGDEANSSVPISKDDWRMTRGQIARQWADLKSRKPLAMTAVRGENLTKMKNWSLSDNDTAREIGHSSIAFWIDQMSSEQAASVFRKFLKEHGDWLAGDNSTWGTVAYAFANSPTKFKRDEMVTWVKGYKSREDLPAWVMTNVHELLRLTGDEARGREAVRYAMSLPIDHMLSQLALWAAHDCLVEGNPKGAMHEFMKAARMEDLHGTDQLMHLWIEGVLHVLASPDKAEAFAEVKQQFKSLGLEFKFFKEQPVYRNVFRSSVDQIAAGAGTFGAKIWATSQKAKLFFATL